MLVSADVPTDDVCSAIFLALPLAPNRLTDAPDCVRKTCCKKYKKGKRCKSCPKR